MGYYQLKSRLGKRRIVPESWDLIIDGFCGQEMASTWPRGFSAQLAPATDAGNTDFPSMNDVIPVVSTAAMNALSDLLSPCGEFLPIETIDGCYYAYNCCILVQAVDSEKSDVEFYPDGRWAFPRHIVLRSSALYTPAFKLESWPSGITFVDQRVHDAVRLHGLVGASFAPVESVD